MMIKKDKCVWYSRQADTKNNKILKKLKGQKNRKGRRARHNKHPKTANNYDPPKTISGYIFLRK